MRRARILLLALAGAPLLGGAPVAGATGVSIDVGAIAVSEALAPGGEYRLPSFGVRNPGTEASSYTLVLSDAGDNDPAPPPAWFRFEPAEVTLGPGESAAVQTVIVVPIDAKPGDYAALIGARISIDGGGAQVGAGAAARLTFSVAPASPVDAWLRSFALFLEANPWAAQLLLGGALVLALVVIRRRFTITIARR